MKRHFLTLLLVMALAPAAAYAQSYSAILTGEAEVPGPGDADGSGIAVITIEGTSLHYTVWAQNIGTPTAAHIHTGASGVAGAIFVPLEVNTLTNGTATITQAQADAINANPSGYYVNVHTSEFQGGAVRGQLSGVPGTGGSAVAFIPGIGKVVGGFGTNFVTDLRIVNNGASTATVTLEYFAQSPTGQSAPTATATVLVGPGEQEVLDDVMATLGVASGLGGLRISADQNVEASARIINDLRADDGGTAGFAVDALEEAQTSGTIMFLTQNGDYRTNIGYFNPNATEVTATVTARRVDGTTLGSQTVTIPGYSFVQQPVFGLLSTVPSGDQTQDNFYVTWSAGAPLFIYAAVTDNVTGDAVLNQ